MVSRTVQKYPRISIRLSHSTLHKLELLAKKTKYKKSELARFFIIEGLNKRG